MDDFFFDLLTYTCPLTGNKRCAVDRPLFDNEEWPQKKTLDTFKYSNLWLFWGSAYVCGWWFALWANHWLVCSVKFLLVYKRIYPKRFFHRWLGHPILKPYDLFLRVPARIKVIPLAKSPALPNEELTERIVRPEGLPCKGNSAGQMMAPQAVYVLFKHQSKIILIQYVLVGYHIFL